MKKIDTKKIINKTNLMIGYANFEREENMNKEKMRKTFYSFAIIAFVICSTLSVNAMTDGKISKAIENLFTIKIDNEDYNAECVKNNDGTINCTLQEKSKDSSVDINITKQILEQTSDFSEEEYEVKSVVQGNWQD